MLPIPVFFGKYPLFGRVKKTQLPIFVKGVVSTMEVSLFITPCSDHVRKMFY